MNILVIIKTDPETWIRKNKPLYEYYRARYANILFKELKELNEEYEGVEITSIFFDESTE